MNVSIIGGGYVGLVTGVCLAEIGHDVQCVDIDADKVRRINQGRPPIHEPGLAELLQRHAGKSFRASTGLRSAVLSSDLTMLAVGTPFDGTKVDLSHVERAAQQVGAALADKSGYHLVVVKSTVVPGTTDEVVAPILATAAGKTIGEHVGLAVNPEFLSEGTAVWDFSHPDRIVLGGDERGRATLRELYAPFQHAPTIETTTRGAEMIKYASNSLLATMISFSNEIGNLCARLGGIDAREVFRGVHLSQYLSTVEGNGSRRPAPITAFLAAGCGFGGSCLPKDVSALAAHGQARGEAMPLLSSVLEINRGQPRRMIELLKRHIPNLEGRRVAVLGLAFKPDTDDVRESPALPLIQLLQAEGARVSAYDPVANGNARIALGQGQVGSALELCDSLEDAVRTAEAILLVTAWNEFRALPEMLRSRACPPLIVDGRRLLDPAGVERYEAIGLSNGFHDLH